MIELNIIDTGLKKYSDVLQIQTEFFNENVSAKLNNQSAKNFLILCEHYPVFTLGKSGNLENILVSDNEMNAEFYRTNRGGDVTFHGPGQLVAYPILDLDALNIGLAQYIFNLEEVILESLLEYNLVGERISSATGVWFKNETGERKICAIGVKASRGITMHGLAMNVNTDLSYFNKIIPCGLENKAVTSLKKELGKEMNMEVYKSKFLKSFTKVFNQV